MSDIMFELNPSTKFKKSFKKVSKYPKFDKEFFKKVTTSLQKREPLDPSLRDHGVAKTSFPEIQGMRILHLSPNICLIYRVDKNEKQIYLYNIGSHQDTGLTEDI